MPTTVQPHWLYRVVCLAIDVNRHRAMWTMPWLSTDAPVSDNDTAHAVGSQGFGLQFPFGAANPINYGATQIFVEELWPHRRLIEAYNKFAHSPTPILNPAAPEAAFRLRRVGAGGSLVNCGRISFPIRDDSWFTDLPHRRRVDVARFAPLFAAHFPAFGNTYTQSGRTYHHVIYNRKDYTWVNVVSHVLDNNVTRIWHRLRRYDPTRHHDDDAHFCPPEVKV